MDRKPSSPIPNSWRRRPNLPVPFRLRSPILLNPVLFFTFYLLLDGLEAFAPLDLAHAALHFPTLMRVW